jgi:hypothetical protein
LKRFKINWAIPGLLAMVFVIAAVAWIQTKGTIPSEPAAQAAECAACHTMDTHVTAWKDSSHKDVACSACHADDGLAGWAHQEVGLLKMYLNKGNVDLAQIKADVPNQRCLDCHARQMPWVMQDLKPPKLDDKGNPVTMPTKDQLTFLPATAGHDVHLTMDNKLNCTDCHSAVSHGPAAQDKPGRVEDWHQVCLDCHAEKKVTLTVRNDISCSACHLDMAKIKPADHGSAAFRDSHGKSAKDDPASCSQCHLNTITPANGTAPHSATAAKPNPLIAQLPPNSVKLPEGVTPKDNCAACHGTTMPHPANFLTSHVKGFNEQPQQCAACHGTKDQGFNMAFKGDPKSISTTDPTCTGCHQQPMPHPAGYESSHGQAAQLSPASCAQCHSSANKANPDSPHSKPLFCQECHLNKFSHPGNFTSTHKLVLSRAGNDPSAAGCTQCHSTTAGGTNSCTTCHTNGFGSNQAWHPSDWVGTHKDTLAQYGNSQSAAGCTKCHTNDTNDKTGLSCTTCHTNGVGNTQQWHPTDWTATHKDTLAQAGNSAASAGCTQCHSTSKTDKSDLSCTTCHTNGVNNTQQWHPTDWVGTHKDALAKSGNNQTTAGCTQCHPTNDKANSTGLSCTACHKNGPDQPTQWHPNFWWVTHAQTTKPSDAQSCNKCHSYIEPSCTKCHSNPF